MSADLTAPPPMPMPDIWVREDFGLGDSTVHEGYTAEQVTSRDAIWQERIASLVAQRAELVEALALIVQWDNEGLALTESHIHRAKAALAKIKETP